MDLREQLQQTIGSVYVFEREIEGGGMSRIFVAEEIELGRKVVVKVLSGEIGANLSAERFAKEVRLAASLQHPNIVPILRAGTAGDLPYYTMPYITGESLRSRVQHSGPLTTAEAISILHDVARAREGKGEGHCQDEFHEGSPLSGVCCPSRPTANGQR